MVEELFSAGATSVPYALAVYYLCELRGSFFIVWLIFYVTNAVGISKPPALPPFLMPRAQIDGGCKSRSLPGLCILMSCCRHKLTLRAM